MKIGDLLQTKQGNLSHLVGLYMGQYNECSDPPMVQIHVLWSDGMKTVEWRDSFIVVSEKSS